MPKLLLVVYLVGFIPSLIISTIYFAKAKGGIFIAILVSFLWPLLAVALPFVAAGNYFIKDDSVNTWKNYR